MRNSQHKHVAVIRPVQWDRGFTGKGGTMPTEYPMQGGATGTVHELLLYNNFIRGIFKKEVTLI